MISFSKLGTRSGLGNHLFQYAFLRTSARRLGVQFYCPAWIGDQIFCLNDSDDKADRPSGIMYEYKEPYQYTGLNEAALGINDGTEIQGYFQTEKYFDRNNVLQWYRFKEEKIASIRERFKHIDLANSVGLSVRLGDFITTYGDIFYAAKRDYYLRALELTPRRNKIAVFSDDIKNAKILLGDLGKNITYIENYEPYEGLYLQSQCRDFICSASTYSWWGAWLNQYPDKVIIVPKEGAFRPGAPVRNDDYWPEGWYGVQALRPILDNYHIVSKQIRIMRGFLRATRFLTKKFRRTIQ